MIVDPDLLDHWRTRMLVDALGGDELAPMYAIRIWAHCQQRRGDAFDMPAAGLKALCRASVDAETLERALVDAGFVARNGATLSVMAFDGCDPQIARRLDVSASAWLRLRSGVFARDGWACVYCGSADSLECDHVVPVVRGGLSTPENLVTACQPCNRSKGAKTLDEWRPN